MAQFEDFQLKFIEEATDSILDLEKALLDLELSPNNQELIEKVFRIMHSLKGGGAMFGFIKLSEFTHYLESAYEKVRDGKLAVTSRLLSYTFESIDLLRDLLDTDKLERQVVIEQIARLQKSIESFLGEETQNNEQPIGGTIRDNSEIKKVTYYIHFYPQSHALHNGNNLAYLIDELSTFGDFYAIPGINQVPCIEDLKCENSYLYWDMFLSTEKPHNEIKDVFIFVEGDAHLEIRKISNINLFENSHFSNKLKKLHKQQDKFELSEFNELLNIKPSTNQVDLSASIYSDRDEAKSRSSSSIRVASNKIDGLMNLVSELVITQERLNMIASRHQIPELKMVTENVQKLTGALRDSAFSISLIPVESLITRFQRLVRDLSNDLGKEIKFVPSGAETELDKTMIESISDPLLHIIRNSIDHGIEFPEERKKKGKPSAGNIRFEAGYSGANVMIHVSDDGCGIDLEKVQRKAIEKGIIKEEDKLSKQEILDLVFLPGFTTASSITEVSGRGVGMDVVKRNISAIRGEVSIKSELGKGTTVSITLPLVLSIIDGLLVKIAQTNYVIPLSLTDRIYPVSGELLKNQFIDVITLDGKQYPFINLRRELEIKGDMPERCQMVVVKINGNQYALSVDYVIGKIQTVLKPLGRLYHHQKMISAATIMGDGSISLVIDPEKLVQSVILQKV